MKKILISILTIFWILLSFCSADYIIYNEDEIPSDCETSFFSYRVPYGFSTYNSDYNCLYIVENYTPINIVNSTNTLSFWSFTDLYHKLVCSADSVFYFNNDYYTNWYGADFRGCSINISVENTPKFIVNYSSTSYEYELEDNLFIYLKSPIVQSWNTFTYAWSTWINLYFNGSSQFYNKDKLFLNTPSWFNNNVFTPICL